MATRTEFGTPAPVSSGAHGQYDLICIGGGPAGQGAAELATLCGLRTVVVERSTLGGVVVTNAGIPTKTLREAALHITGFRARDLYGLTYADEPRVVLERLRTRTVEVRNQVQAAVRSSFAAHGIDVLYGSARLHSKDAVVVTPNDGGSPRTIHAEMVLIATGSQPLRPPMIPFDDPDVFDSETLLSITRIPGTVLVVGGGAVGCEYASIFTALGTDVTLVDTADRLLSMMDEEMSTLAATVFERQGMRIASNASVRAVQRNVDGLSVTLTSGEVIRPQALLFAAGRSVRTEGLGVADVGVATTARGCIQVDDQYRTTAGTVFAAGDVIGPTLASVAMEQGRAAVSHAFGLGLKEFVSPRPVSAVYSIPQVAGVGLTEDEARTMPGGCGSARCSFTTLPAAIIAGHTEGMLKLVFANDDLRLLGVHSLGETAADLVALGQVVIREGGSLATFRDLTFANPTYTMAYKEAAIDGLVRAAHARGFDRTVAPLTARR
jgi:NAD(P) transhydrogenase